MDKEKKWKKWRMEKNGENSCPLTSLPVDRLNGDRVKRRPLVPIKIEDDLEWCDD